MNRGSRPFPVGVDVVAGQAYLWCACGRSASQPWCDGSHAGTGVRPLTWTATVSRREVFCTCKRSASAPICDGSHKRR